MEYRWAPEPYLTADYRFLNPSLDDRGRLLQQADLDREERRFAERMPGLYRLMYDKWRIDELYDATVVGMVDALARARVGDEGPAGRRLGLVAAEQVGDLRIRFGGAEHRDLRALCSRLARRGLARRGGRGVRRGRVDLSAAPPS